MNENSINSDKYVKERIAYLTLLSVNFIFYAVFLIWLPVESQYNFPIYSVPIIAAFYVAEGGAFFGCQGYSWAASVTFRILFLIHDFSYFVTYAVLGAKTGESPGETIKRNLESCIGTVTSQVTKMNMMMTTAGGTHGTVTAITSHI